MTELYKHFWLNDDDFKKKAQPWVQEGKPATTLEDAINDYYQERGFLIYSYTLVWDEDKKTCRIFDIAEEIEDQERESEKQAMEDLEERLSLRLHFNWAQAGRCK